jgi:hypothetical protein
VQEKVSERRPVHPGLAKLSLAKSHSVPGEGELAGPWHRSEADRWGEAEGEEAVDTSASLRSLQQEIESLLAPLTPLPDLEQVGQVEVRVEVK